MGVFSWGRPPASSSSLPPPVDAGEATTTSKVFPRFLTAVTRPSGTPRPEVLDLGPVTGANVEFLGERLACRLSIENLFDDLERARQAGRPADPASGLAARLGGTGARFDGILCWDLFDFLDVMAGRRLAGTLAHLLRPGGVVYGFFGTTPVEVRQYTRYVIDAETRFRLRRRPASPVTRTVLLSRDLARMFEGLSVVESVLLRTGARETLFRRT